VSLSVAGWIFVVCMFVGLAAFVGATASLLATYLADEDEEE
jgi:hypothetical protein